MKPLHMFIHAVLLLAGLTGIYFASKLLQKTQALLADGVFTTAKVIEVLEEPDDESITYRPKFQYVDKEDRPVQFTGSIGTGHKVWSVGEEVKVVYRPTDPKSVRIVTYWNLHRASILLFAFSLPLVAIGAGYFLFHISIRDTVL